MDKLEIQEVIAEKEERLKNLERMQEKYSEAGNAVAANRASHRATEVVEDLHDLRQALAEFEERDGQIRTGSE